MENYLVRFVEDGQYTSPRAEKRIPFHQRFFGRSLSFNVAYALLVHRGVILAHRGLYDDQAWLQQAWDLVKIIERHGGHFQVTGIHNLKDQGPMVLAANHMSTLETQVLTGFVTPFSPTTFVVKESLTRGYYAPLITSRPYISVTRKNIFHDFENVINLGSKILDEGRSVIIFPQGTREYDSFTPRRFNSLATKLALRSGYPLVPIAVRSDFWGRNTLFKDVARIDADKPIHLAFGKPLKVEDKGKEQQQQALNFICRHLSEWGVTINE